MPGVARGDGVDSVDVPHGTGTGCVSPIVSATDECSDNVFINGTGVVRKDDAMAEHPAPGCAPHSPALTTHSSNVYANNKQIGDLGDSYACGGVISSASDNVFANGGNPT